MELEDQVAEEEEEFKIAKKEIFVIFTFFVFKHMLTTKMYWNMINSIRFAVVNRKIEIMHHYFY
jgi:hypothetical protein